MSLDAERLRKLLLLALSSDQPGEAQAAITKIRAQLTKAGLDIHWLANAVLPVARAPMPFQWPAQRNAPSVGWKAMLAYCAAQCDWLKPKERDFIDSLMQQAERDRWAPSERQASWLTAIYTRVMQQ